MRDGVRARGRCLRAASAPGAVPAIRCCASRTGAARPTWASTSVGEFFARKGYACVVQDVRGKFSSERRVRPRRRTRSRTATTPSTGRRTQDVVRRPRRPLGRVVLRRHVAGPRRSAGTRRCACIAPGDIGVDRRGSWFRQGALLLNTTGYWAMAMDGREYADLTRIDPWHLPLAGMAKAAGARGPRSSARSSTASRTRPGGGAAACATCSPRCAARCCRGAGWYDNYIGPQLSDYAAAPRDHPRPETVHLLVGPWDHEGCAEHTDRAACVQLPRTAAHRWDAYQAFFDRYLRDERRRLRARRQVEVFTHRAQRLAARRRRGRRRRRCRRRSTCGPAACSTFEPPAADEAPDTYRLRPGRSRRRDASARNCWALCDGARRPPRRSSSGRTSSRTCPSRSPTTSS